MKKKILLLTLLSLFISVKLYAQICPNNVQELMTYFDNSESLDPIEGVYDVNVEQWGENAFQRFPSETTNITMLIYRDINGVFRVFKNNQVTLKRIGDTSIYNYIVFWSGSNISDANRFILKNGTFFDVNYSIPDRQLRHDLGSNYQAGSKVCFKNSFIKTYPSQVNSKKKMKE